MTLNNEFKVEHQGVKGVHFSLEINQESYLIKRGSGILFRGGFKSYNKHENGMLIITDPGKTERNVLFERNIKENSIGDFYFTLDTKNLEAGNHNFQFIVTKDKNEEHKTEPTCFPFSIEFAHADDEDNLTTARRSAKQLWQVIHSMCKNKKYVDVFSSYCGPDSNSIGLINVNTFYIERDLEFSEDMDNWRIINFFNFLSQKITHDDKNRKIHFPDVATAQTELDNALNNLRSSYSFFY